jgi:hypothetical protein
MLYGSASGNELGPFDVDELEGISVEKKVFVEDRNGLKITNSSGDVEIYFMPSYFSHFDYKVQ